eukprot:6251132-Pyramimonas_sp.AAC.1
MPGFVRSNGHIVRGSGLVQTPSICSVPCCDWSHPGYMLPQGQHQPRRAAAGGGAHCDGGCGGPGRDANPHPVRWKSLPGPSGGGQDTTPRPNGPLRFMLSSEGIGNREAFWNCFRSCNLA